MKRTARSVEAELRELGDPDHAAFLPRYFKTGPGEYAEGDVFLGIPLPEIRRVAREHESLALTECAKLLGSRYHEVRAVALVILVRKYGRADERERGRIFRLYLANLAGVNNWDLVDVSAPQIVGRHLFDRPRGRSLLDRLARSRSLWRRRIAIVSTHWLIREGEFADTLRIADLLLEDDEDLIHKAVGWMIREVGKRDPAALRRFLAPRYRRMPRTMLRYAIERLPAPTRKRYLKGDV